LEQAELRPKGGGKKKEPLWIKLADITWGGGSSSLIKSHTPSDKRRERARRERAYVRGGSSGRRERGSDKG